MEKIFSFRTAEKLYQEKKALFIKELKTSFKSRSEIILVPPVKVSIVNRAPHHFLTKILKSLYLILKENENIFEEFIERVRARARPIHLFALHQYANSWRAKYGHG